MGSPRTAGEMRKGGSLSGSAPMTLVVRYNCVMGGSTVITVRIPPVRLRPAQGISPHCSWLVRSVP